ncbi:hypothetical protein HC864_05045 [Candidatus Gracilibacteria bacterium]|nr:hypothetical protein [Candidatus Gracilibacteria bacterium]
MVSSKINWFDKFLAIIITFLTLVMFVGISGANHSSHREINASLGLLKRANNSKVGQSIKYLFTPVQANAQNGVVKIISDIPRIAQQALEKALKQALSALIKSFINAIMKVFDQLLSAIEGWVGTIDGLKDAIGAFRQAIALKAYQVSECLIESSESVVSKIFGSDSSVAPTNNPQEKCNGVFGSSTGSREANVLTNELSSIRSQNLFSATEAENITGFADFSVIPSQEEIKVKVENFAVDAAVLSGCTDDGGSSSLDNDPILPVKDINLVKSVCNEEISNNITETNKTLANDIQNKEKVQTQTFSQAPSECPFGYVSGGIIEGLSSNSGAANAANNIQSVGGGALSSDVESSLTAPEGAIKVADSFDLETLNNEECQNANRGPATLAATQASADQGGSEFDFNQVITAFVEAITQFVTNLINKVFNLLTQVISKFLSNAPGGEYLSQAISNIINPVSSAIQADIQAISDNIIKDINN